MSKLNWEAAKWRRRQTPLLTEGMVKKYQKDARHFAKRIANRKKQAKRDNGRILTLEEKVAVAEKMGWAVAASRKPSEINSDGHDNVPWWSDEELAAGKKGIQPHYDTSYEPLSRNQHHKGRGKRQ